jgi:hypothetical protein
VYETMKRVCYFEFPILLDSQVVTRLLRYDGGCGLCSSGLTPIAGGKGAISGVHEIIALDGKM